MIKKLCYAILILIILLISFLLFTVTTNLGLRFSLQLTALVSNGNFSAVKMTGTWLKGATISQFSFENPTYRISAAELNWSWQWHNLFHPTVTIKQLSSTALYIHQKQSTPKTKPASSFSIPSIPIDITIKQAELNQTFIQIAGSKPFVIQSIQLAASIIHNNIQIQHLSVLSAPYKFTSQGQVNLAAPYTISLNNYLEYDFDKNQILKIDNKITGDIQKFYFTLKARDPYQIQLNGTVTDLAHQAKLTVDGQWEKIHFYDERQVKVFSTHGALSLAGTLDHYTLRLGTNIKSIRYPEANIFLFGQGNLTSFSIDKSLINTLDGEIYTSGKITWSPELQWNLNIQAKKINPGSYWPSWRGNLNAELVTSGTNGPAPSLSIKLQNLSGSLQGASLSGSGLIQHQQDQWQIQHFQLQSKANNLDINGLIGKTHHLTWNINLHDMRQLSQAAGGSLVSSGTLNGSMDNIKLTGNINANRFILGSIKTANLTGNFNIDETSHYTVRLTGSNIQFGNQAISQININSNGTPQQHRLSINLNSSFGNLISEIAGSYQNSAWHSQINRFNFSSAQYGHWQLKSPAKIILGEKYSIENFFLYNGKNHISVAGKYSPNNDKLDANIDIQLNELSLIQQFWDGWQNLSGQISIKGKLDGDINHPNFNGAINLRNINTVIPEYGIKITNTMINILYREKNMGNLTGSLVLNGSKLNLTGSLPLTDNFSPANLHITGGATLIYNTKEYQITGIPDINLTYIEPTLTISGTLTIPKANITPKDFSSTVELPSNVVILTGDDTNQSKFNTALDLQINLGDNIHFAYAGIFGDVTGHLRIMQSPEGLMLGQGFVEVKKGYYSAYNQRLNIQTGELLFTGGVIGNPNLNILATKVIKLDQFSNPSFGSRVTVGVQVTGTMHKPKINLYSIPPMSSNNVLSFLLFGQSADNLNNQKFQVLSQAASALGVSGDSITSKIKNDLGLSQVGFDTENIYDPATQQYEQGSAFTVGKKITPRLSINYSIGILVPVSILRARYIISKHWAVQSDTSSYDSGGDLLYTIETN